MKIMVATDGSRGSTAALNFAARLASGEEGSELTSGSWLSKSAGASRSPATRN